MMNYLTKKRKAQVTVYIFSAIATLIIVSFVIINVGKTAKDKTHADNAADAGALAACSAMATGFNYMADEQKKSKDIDGKGQRDMFDTYNKTAGNRSTDGPGGINPAKDGQYGRAESGLEGNSSPGDPSTQGAESQAVENEALAKIQKNIEAFLNNVVEQLWPDSQNKEDKARQTLDDGSNPAAQDYQNEAISMGYKICFQNSGTHHRLGKISSKMYEQFMKSLEPGTVQSGMPMTFFWVDGSARAHMVTCVINVEAASDASVRTSQDDAPTLADKAGQESQDVGSSQSANSSAGTNFGLAEICYIPFEFIANAFSSTGQGFREKGQGGHNSERSGLNNSKVTQSATPQDNNNEIVKNIDDINNSRTVSAANFQFHMGSPIKSIVGDIDMVTFYPPVQSTAMATFNYTGSGAISDHGDEGGGQSPTHECGLMGAF